MPHARYTNDEIARRGQALYDQHIRDEVAAGNDGKFVVVDIETGTYELDADELAALHRAKAKRPDAALYILRVGHSAAYRLGGPFSVAQT